MNYLITGATGLIGRNLVEAILDKGGKIIAPVMDLPEAECVFQGLDDITVFEWDLLDKLNYDGDVDYIIHCAAPTSSEFFVNKPVETIDCMVNGTRNVLEFARRKQVKSMVYLSSMEVYGASLTDEPITEDKQFYVDPLTIRSSYPMAKRLAETLCVSYCKEYTVPARIARLGQVIAESIPPNDNRVIAQFLHSVKENKDIEIATDGEAKQTYIGIKDTVSGLLAVLENGDNGEAYNIADTDSFCSIKQLAEMIRNIANSDIKIVTNCGDASKYPPNRVNKIDNTKLIGLGWERTNTLEENLTKLWKNL